MNRPASEQISRVVSGAEGEEGEVDQVRALRDELALDHLGRVFEKSLGRGRPVRHGLALEAVELPALPPRVHEAHKMEVHVPARPRRVRLPCLRLGSVHRADRFIRLQRSATVSRVHREGALREGTQRRVGRDERVGVEERVDACYRPAGVAEVVALPEEERLPALLRGALLLRLPRPLAAGEEKNHGADRLGHHRQHVIVQPVHVVERYGFRRSHRPDEVGEHFGVALQRGPVALSISV
mmetsp:Transcript_19496/g.43928  ORF Transcript_19496/g.43928 Transcript_19496/m.43928 type:complete len:240 (+) Transcript_19496:197-916(+)